MKEEKKDLHMLLGVIFLLCASIGMLHVKKVTGSTTPRTTTQKHTSGLQSLSAQDAFDYLTPLFVSGNVHGAARMLPQFNPAFRTALVQKIISEQHTTLDAEQKLAFMLHLITTYAHDAGIQNALFDTIADHKLSLPYDHMLAMVTQDTYKAALAPLLAWLNKHKTGTYSSFAQALIKEGLSHISATNNIRALDVLLSQKIPLSKKQATSLLHTVVTTNRNAEFVPLLVQKAHANVHYVDSTKHTLLMYAVLNNNLKMVHALLQEKVNPNKLTNPAIGTALQLAIGKRFVDIELLLRKFGAKE